MAYSELYMGDELPKLQEGLEVIEKAVSFDAISDLSLWLYGIVKDPYILDIAKEAIAEDENSSLMEDDIEINESEVELSEIAVAIHISSSNVISILYGRGIRLYNLSFYYQSSKEGEGVRDSSFIAAHSAKSSSAALKASNMETMAVASDEYEAMEFLKDKGTTKMQIKRKIQRDEEATLDRPHTEPPPKPVTSSLVLSALLERFLG